MLRPIPYLMPQESNQVFRLVEGIRAGQGIGLAVAWSGAGLLSAFLFDVGPRHVATYAGAVAGVLVISYVAAYLPARRAAGVNPVSALKDE